MVNEDWKNGGFGIYVHWPFCQSKCPYCDFNSHVAAEIDENAWKAAYRSELARAAEELPDRLVNSIFFGGGTPSTMSADLVASIIDSVSNHWTLANDIEISLEANPTSVEASRFAGYADAGVNRISMGIQSLEEESLRKLGRLHTVAEARSAFDVARTQFDRVSFDLIYARQDQSLAAWKDELNQALSMGLDHLSLYQLTVEDGTAFGKLHSAGRLKGLPSDALAADMYALTQELCDAAGLPAYEVSNHAKPENASRHNLIYWRGGDFLGVGPGAHGRLTLDGQRNATETYLAPEKWLNAVNSAGTGETLRSPVSAEDQASEYLMMSLRLSEGTDLVRLRNLSKYALDENNLKDMVDMGLLVRNEDRLSATPSGRIILNSVLRSLLAD